MGNLNKNKENTQLTRSKRNPHNIGLAFESDKLNDVNIALPARAAFIIVPNLKKKRARDLTFEESSWREEKLFLKEVWCCKAWKAREKLVGLTLRRFDSYVVLRKRPAKRRFIDHVETGTGILLMKSYKRRVCAKMMKI